jgi:hypothetical protein
MRSSYLFIIPREMMLAEVSHPMIAFVSLFLGLMFGSRPVEVVVGEGVAAVELRLDGQRVDLIRQAPWVMACDFGPNITPRLLEAVAFDAQNRELGRVRQWLNLPQASAVLNAVLGPREEGGARVARLSWESSAGAEPKSVVAFLDGTPLAVPDPHRIELPSVDESQFHLLNVEMEFENRVTSRVDLTFGGSYADEVNTEITALPIEAVGKLKQAPTVAGVQGWFLEDGKTLRVVAVEKEQMELVFVMDRPFGRFFGPGERRKIPKALHLTDEHRIRFVASIPTQSQGVGSTFELFPISRTYGKEFGDLYRLLSGMGRPPQNSPAQPTSAVAVAGLAAYESRRRRAVVLIPSERHTQDGKVTPAQVRSYLEDLHVPFFVWEPERKPSEQFAAWGKPRPAGTIKDLAAAFEEINRILDRQWVVWIDGKHLPQRISLSSEVKNFTLTQ